ncbi:MAG: hypothetical protein HFH41_09110 [Lachnospiraceae bacterium]|nr:hypothetical protein [Lachnospiraceae bacterium]
MCSNVKSYNINLSCHPAVMFMNSNKSEINIRKMIQENRQICSMAGISLMKECIIHKGPGRDIDREAVNMLIVLLLTGKYDTIVVKELTDITDDKSDLEEFMRDTAGIGVGFFEISTMRYYIYEEMGRSAGEKRPVWKEEKTADEDTKR